MFTPTGGRLETRGTQDVSMNAPDSPPHALSSKWVRSASLPGAGASCFSWADLSDSEGEEETFTELTNSVIEPSTSSTGYRETDLEFVQTEKNRGFQESIPPHLSPLTSGTPTASETWSRELQVPSMLSREREYSSSALIDNHVAELDHEASAKQPRSDLCSSVCESFDLFGYASRSLSHSIPGKNLLCHSNSDPSRERLETADAEVALLPLRERDASSMDLHQVHQLWQSSRALLESNRRLQNSESDQPRRENERGFSLYAAVANRVELEEVVDAAERASDAIVHGGARIERPSRSGVSGAYLIRNVTGTQNVLGIFKPFDEETAGTELPLQPAEAYFHPAEGAFKECAAYLLDHGHFANVPQTALAKCRFVERCGEEQTRKTKCGAFQVYYRNHGDAEDFGPGVFDTEAVQRIAAFDIRVLQCDRNASNVLVCDTAELLRHRGYWRESEMPEHGSERSSSRAQMQLVAIDHAYILPEQVPTVPRACWMDWTQSRNPVVDSVRRYVAGLDSLADVKLLVRELGPHTLRQGSLRSLCIGTLLLKLGIETGLTLYQIGLLVYGDAASTHSTESWQSTRAARSHYTQDSRLDENHRSDLGRFENRSKLETLVLEAERVSLSREKRFHLLVAEEQPESHGSLYEPHREESDGVFAFEEQLQATTSNLFLPKEEPDKMRMQPYCSIRAAGKHSGTHPKSRSWSFDDSDANLVAICALESPYFYRYLAKLLNWEIQALQLMATESSDGAVTGTGFGNAVSLARQVSDAAKSIPTTARGNKRSQHNVVVSGLCRSRSVPNLAV